VREVRRLWLHRIIDHDGTQEGKGGIEKWLRLGEACGLHREELLSEQNVTPAARFAVDAYVHFARSKPWPIAVASSLTELFAPDLMAKRIDAFRRHYTWIAESGLEYFTRQCRPGRARFGRGTGDHHGVLHITEMQEAAVKALEFKCDVLWSLLDAIQIRCAPEVAFVRMTR
jgi:pyrroloquinoline-quinone synthase